MSAEMLFRWRARVDVPGGLDASALRTRLEKLAQDLMVQVILEERVEAR